MPSDRLSDRLGALPARPGVYVLRDGGGEILYVGKAKSLRSRVRSYFGSDAARSPKGAELAARTEDVETFVLDSEAEALLLEANLIKEHAPRFNIQLRDDKSYPYVKVTVQEPFPRVLVTRRLEADGSRYFGPYTDVGAMRRALRTVRQIYTVRSCHWDLPERSPDRPCLDYHIHRCRAPCVGLQSREEYGAMIDEILHVLGGRTGEVRVSVRRRMQEAASRLEYERAAELRDVLRGLDALERKQAAVDFRGGDRDALGIHRDEESACCVLLRVREGRLLGRQVRSLGNVTDEPDASVVEAAVKGFYLRQEDLPPELLVPAEFPDRGLVEEILSLRRDGAVRIRVPRRGTGRRLLDMARENAAQHQRERRSTRRTRGAEGSEDRGEAIPMAASALRRALDLPGPPRTLACFDISTLGGTDSVGALSWLADGRPLKDEYRRFRIRGTPEGDTDDYAMMHEVVSRYFHRRVREGRELPDLVLIDGGKGQLGAARHAMESAGVSDLPVAALAKREEEVFLPERRDPVRLETTDPGLHWLQRARDEAHRFAVRYNRTLRRRRTLRSRLSEVRGVGARREAELLRRFGSVEAIRRLSPEELSRAPGIGPKTAARILETLREGAG